MSETSKPSKPTTSGVTDNATSSQASEDGPLLFDLPAGPSPTRSGQAPAPASRFLFPEGAEALTMSGIFGLFGSPSSKTYSLQQSLENRLIARMAAFGSMIYELTWKRWDMPSGPPVCALQASQRRTTDSDCIGWPTALAGDAKGSKYQYSGGKRDRIAMKLPGAAAEAGWPTPTARDGKGIDAPGRQGGQSLPELTRVVGWATPNSNGSAGEVNENLERKGNKWVNRKSGRVLQTNLATDVKMLFGWATPNAADGQGSYGGGQGRSLRTDSQMEAHGTVRNGSSAPTARRGSLNPALSLWLMGFPSDWLMAAPVKARRGANSSKASATPSSPGSRRSSSRRALRRHDA